MNKFFALPLLAAAVSAQQIGTNTSEQHLELGYQTCDSNGCQSNQGQVVLDSNWRWVHNVGGYTNCYTGAEWNSQYCSNNKECAEKCAVDGVDQQTWRDTYGVSSTGSDLRLNFVTNTQYGANVGSRTYLMDKKGHYM